MSFVGILRLRSRRALLILGGVFLAAALVVVGAGWSADRSLRSDPRLCGTCHAMQTPLRLWAEGEHAEVPCQGCHALDRLDGLRMLWGVVRGTPPGREHARVSPDACKACHAGPHGIRSEVAASSGHLAHAARGAANCLDCHAVSTHKARPTQDACRRCHPDREVDLAGMEGLHCLACHDFRSGGDTIVPRRPDCLRCHRRRDVAEDRFPDGAPMAFRCSACHAPHRQDAGLARQCTECHEVQHLRGLHAQHPEPGTRCVACHPAHAWTSTPTSCVACHQVAPDHGPVGGCASLECHPFRAVRPQ